jgi:hypothetical protein
MANNQQLQAELVVQLVGIMADEDKATLVAMLKKNGSLVTENNTKSQILDATFKAIRDSANFRKDLENYLIDKSTESNFSNVDGKGWEKFKNIFNTVFTKENVASLTGAGIGYLGASLQAKANKGQGQQAIDYTKAQSELADKQAQLLLLQQGLVGSSANQGGGGNTPPSTRPKWVVPVAIGGGLLVVGLIVYFATRKK